MLPEEVAKTLLLPRVDQQGRTALVSVLNRGIEARERGRCFVSVVLPDSVWNGGLRKDFIPFFLDSWKKKQAIC